MNKYLIIILVILIVSPSSAFVIPHEEEIVRDVENYANEFLKSYNKNVETQIRPSYRNFFPVYQNKPYSIHLVISSQWGFSLEYIPSETEDFSYEIIDEKIGCFTFKTKGKPCLLEFFRVEDGARGGIEKLTIKGVYLNGSEKNRMISSGYWPDTTRTFILEPIMINKAQIGSWIQGVPEAEPPDISIKEISFTGETGTNIFYTTNNSIDTTQIGVFFGVGNGSTLFIRDIEINDKSYPNFMIIKGGHIIHLTDQDAIYDSSIIQYRDAFNAFYSSEEYREYVAYPELKIMLDEIIHKKENDRNYDTLDQRNDLKKVIDVARDKYDISSPFVDEIYALELERNKKWYDNIFNVLVVIGLIFGSLFDFLKITNIHGAIMEILKKIFRKIKEII